MIMIKSICEHCKHCLLCMCGDEFKDCKLKQSQTGESIDEMALAFGQMLLSHGESEDFAARGAAGYAMGARKQKDIDDKAMDTLNEVCDNTIRIVKDEMINKAFELIKNWIFENAPHQVYDDFMSDIPELKKVMEE